jgi:hypothetical protein
MVKNLLLQFGIRSMLGFMLAVVSIAVVCALIALRDSKGPVKPKYFGGMLIESALYASLLGTLASRFTDIFMGIRPVAGPVFRTAVQPAGLSEWMIALGAGVYEEIVFRVLLISVLLASFEVLAKLPVFRWLHNRRNASILAAVLAAVLFSAFHYVGIHGEPFLWKTFVYRFFAGLLLAGIYVTRGLGIAAWTHALYDVSILLGMA